MSCKPRHTHNLIATVWLGVHGKPGSVVFGAIAKVNATSEFANDVEVDAFADGFFEWRFGDERRCGEETGSKVAECLELFAEFEETLFRADGTGAPFL